ncbi:2,4'-dihydroxyacetophenone dioxygenase family protein [Tumebacillus flagellatus]|uniref:ChrR-like cupin domain-containing protein n=1 Tax=Tumebacillus flagellatus TaxID=1157490 RepID=A0A074MDL5_9BACL|nr:2,4'-dihydroxyacetophenone dioxygenase family protein [Tumebacillus flagellatus]KEO83937.1 hypothetical protein EL26_07040 [Tumebacillus flagellatus]
MNTKHHVERKVAQPFETVFIGSEKYPWIPWVNDCYLKVLKVNPTNGQFMLMLKTPPQFTLPSHHHYGTVTVFTIQGMWSYVGHNWVAKPGDVVYEPAGSFHKPFTPPENNVPVITFNMLDGCLVFIDDDGNQLGILDWVAAAQMYYDYCAKEGIEPLDIESYDTEPSNIKPPKDLSMKLYE